MLLAYIIHTNNGAKKRRKGNKVDDYPVLGIIYTSTKVNQDFNRPMRYFENVVIPAIDLSNSTGHCPELRKRFDVTTPTCNEYENLRKTVSGIPVGYSRKEGEDDETSRYKGSKWGYLERIIEERDRNERREPQ